MPPDVDRVHLAVDPVVGGRVLRRVGPAAWVVLQGLAARSNGSRRTAQADTNVRELATDLGISKDTVARAINRLVDAKVVRRTTFAQNESGRFAARSYLIDLSRSGLQVFGPTCLDAQISDRAELIDPGSTGGSSIVSTTAESSTRRTRSRTEPVRAEADPTAGRSSKTASAAAQPALFGDS